MYLICIIYKQARKTQAPVQKIFITITSLAAYTKGPHRFTLSYVKQPAGINCTGGVCRYEPAFSGVRFGCTSQF